MENIISKWKAAIIKILGEDLLNIHLDKKVVKIELIKIFEAEIGRKFPQDFYDFYLNLNPINNRISSVFLLESNDGYGYNLLPFSDVPKEYEECNDLNFEEGDSSYDDAEVASEIHPVNYHNNYWIPIAHDYQGNYLMMDLDPSPSGTYGQIIYFQNESWSRTLVAHSLKELLENQLEKLKDKNHVKELYAFELEQIEKNKLQLYFDNEIKTELQNDIMKGLYSTKDLLEKHLDEDDFDEDEIDYKALKKIAKAAIKSYKNELEEQLKNGDFQDFSKLQKALKNLESEHNIVAPYVIGYTQDEAIYEAETLLNEKGAKGFVYFTEQDIERTIEEKYNFALGFNCSQRENDPNFSRGIAIGKTILQELEKQGFETEWDGTINTRIFIKNFLWRCLDYYTNQNTTENTKELEFSNNQNNENPSLNYDLTIENLKKIIYSDRVPNNSDGLDLNIDGIDITIKKPYIDSDGDARGNSIFIDSNSGLQLFISIDIEYISCLHKTNKDDKFVTLDQNSPKSVQNFADSIWKKIVTEMNKSNNELNKNENGLSLQQFKAQFGKHTIPNDLLKLFHFGENHGQYDYSENFYLDVINKTGLKTYSKEATFLNAFIEFAGANGTGSSYAFWLIDDDLNECPIVIFGDEGGIQVIAENFRQLLILLSLDSEPSVSYDEVYFYFDKEDEDYEHSESHDDYVQWLKHNFGLQPITTDEETEAIIEIAKEKYQNQLNEFIAQYETTEEEKEEKQEDSIPKLFNDSTFKNKESFDLQFNNFQKIIAFFENEEGGPRYYFKLPEINASVMIMKEDGNKVKISDGSKIAVQNLIMIDIHKDSQHFFAGDEFMIWKQKEETGFKTLFKKPKYDYTNKDGKPLFSFLLRDPDRSFYKYRIAFELCKVEALQTIWDLILETIEKGVYYKNKYENFVKTADITSILQLPMILEKYPNSWNDSDQCPWFGNSCYSFFQGTDTKFPAIKIVKEIDNINNDFDAKSFYYWFDTSTQKTTLGYLANYHELNDPFYDMRYSKENDAVPFYHYPLYQEAIKLWKKALVVLPKENEKYVAQKKSEDQMEFSETEVEYRKYYIKKPIAEDKLADLTYENFNILANYCEIKDRSYDYDFFIIIREYHWVSIKLTDEWSLHSVTQKKALKFIFLDEPFGNDPENKNYAELKYIVEIDENNYVSFSTNAQIDVDAQKTIQFMLFQLLKEVREGITRKESEDEKEAKREKKKAKKEKERKQNYQVTKPFEKIDIDGITFTLKDRKEASEILEYCTDFDNNKVYDPFYIHYLESEIDFYKSFFLVAENEVIAEKLNLDMYPTDSEEICILGYIFLKKLTLNKYVEAEDLEFSPPIICMDDAEIGSLLLAGNTHYFHKNLNCITLHGEYNHGNLIAKGKTDANFIYADDFNMKFNDVTMVASCSDDRDIEKMNDLSNLDLTIDYELNYLPGMQDLQHCVQDRFIYLDGNYGYRIKDEGYRTGTNHYAQGEETFFDSLRKGECVLDYEKLETNRTMFIANAFAIAKGMFAKHPDLKDLAIGEVYYLFPNPTFNHINFYFQETDEFYFIGYWNTWFNISVSVGLHKSGEQDMHQLTVFYWNKENTATRYSFTVSMDKLTHYNNICQKVFIEALERMG